MLPSKNVASVARDRAARPCFTAIHFSSSTITSNMSLDYTDSWTFTDVTGHVTLRPRVSGSQIHVAAPMSNAPASIENATPNPCVCAIEPTRNGATALPRRPTLNVNPCAIARMDVG